jgi:hypothetical protein
VVCYALTLVYKLVVPGRLVFLLMPCHIYAAALLFLIFTDRHSRTVQRVAYVTLCLNWGTWLAMGSPDTRDLIMFGEVRGRGGVSTALCHPRSHRVVGMCVGAVV